MAKAKVATVWLEACAGCHMSFLDIDERLADLVEKVDILYSPVVDGKEILQVDVGVIDGALGNEEEVHLAKEMRDRCKILVGWGDCAVFGGINCMRNFLSPEKVLEEAYTETKSTVNPEKVIPGEELPALLPKAIPIDHVVKCDVYIPGCPPDADTILWVFQEILEGRVPKVPANMMRYD